MVDIPWGGLIHSNSYEMLLAGSTPISNPTSLVGHGLTNYNADQIDRVTAIIVNKERGKIVPKRVTVREIVILGFTFTLNFTQGAIWTPLLAKVRRGSCEENIYLRDLCPQDPETAHFWAMLRTVFGPATFATDLVTIDDTDNLVNQQSEATVPDMRLVFVVGVLELIKLTGQPLYSVAVGTSECVDCDDAVFETFYVGGGVGGAMDDTLLYKSDDRFSSHDILVHGVADGNVFVGIYASGNTVLACFRDDPAVATAASGGTVISGDGGDSFTPDGNLSVPINDVNYFEGQYIAVGGPGGGQAAIYVSDDGVTWTAVSSSSLSATKALTSIAVDAANHCFYVVGEGGLALKGTKSGSIISLSALAPTGVSTTELHRVAVLGNDNVAIGGASNYYAESFDGGDTWVQPTIPGSAAVNGIAGTTWLRSVVGTGTVFADRSILNNNVYSALTPKAGVTITGDFQDVKSLAGEAEYFVGVTDDGEVCLSLPNSPQA